jgi:hypothetical protein
MHLTPNLDKVRKSGRPLHVCATNHTHDMTRHRARATNLCIAVKRSPWPPHHADYHVPVAQRLVYDDATQSVRLTDKGDLDWARMGGTKRSRLKRVRLLAVVAVNRPWSGRSSPHSWSAKLHSLCSSGGIGSAKRRYVPQPSAGEVPESLSWCRSAEPVGA